MTAENQDFKINVGEAKVIDVAQTDDEDDGGDLDISGFQELTWTMYEYKGGESVVEKKESTSADVSVTDAAVGAYEIKIQPSDTQGILGGFAEDFYHRVRLTDSAGDPSDLLEGEITVEP